MAIPSEFGETRRTNERRRDIPTPPDDFITNRLGDFYENRHSDRHAPGRTGSAICVQRFDDSRNSAIHTTYRSWLRSSSMHEPRDPPLKVISIFVSYFYVQLIKIVIKKIKWEAERWRPQPNGGNTSTHLMKNNSNLHGRLHVHGAFTYTCDVCI